MVMGEVMAEIRERMTRWGAHLRSRKGVADALTDAVALWRRVKEEGLAVGGATELHRAVRTEQQCAMHVAMLKAIAGMLGQGAGSRGSHCVLDPDGTEMHPALIDPATERPYRFRPENESLRDHILRVTYDPAADDGFALADAAPRPIPADETAFELAWARFREGKIYER